MSDLNKLLEQCKYGVCLEVNKHRDYYESAEKTLEDARGWECPPEIEDDIREVMIRTDTIVNLQFYPDTPVASYDLYHYDVDAVLKEALEILKERRTYSDF